MGILCRDETFKTEIGGSFCPPFSFYYVLIDFSRNALYVLHNYRSGGTNPERRLRCTKKSLFPLTVRNWLSVR